MTENVAHKDITQPKDIPLMCACGWKNARSVAGKKLFSEHLETAKKASELNR